MVIVAHPCHSFFLCAKQAHGCQASMCMSMALNLLIKVADTLANVLNQVPMYPSTLCTNIPLASLVLLEDLTCASPLLQPPLLACTVLPACYSDPSHMTHALCMLSRHAHQSTTCCGLLTHMVEGKYKLTMLARMQHYMHHLDAHTYTHFLTSIAWDRHQYRRPMLCMARISSV